MKEIACKNHREQAVLEKFRSNGYKALKKGWPDFLFYNDQGKIILVEVKRKQKRPSAKMGLSDHQSEIRRILSAHFEYVVEYI